MKRFVLIAVLAVLVFTGADCSTTTEESDITFTYTDSVPEETTKTWSFQGELSADKIQNKQIRIETGKGEIVFELFDGTAPMTVSNFVYLTEGGYYDGLTFHRREEGFVIQGGDPNGDGTGGPGYEFQDELKDNYSYERGIVAMANHGANTNGSQFFILLDDSRLKKEYSIFGRVTEGLDIVDKISVGDVMTSVTLEERAQ